MNAAPVLWIGRAQERAAPWSAAAVACGWRTHALSLIETTVLPLSTADRDLLASLRPDDTLFLTSAQAVRLWFEFITSLQQSPHCAIAVVGPSTAAALRSGTKLCPGVEPKWIAPQHTGASLAQSFLASAPRKDAKHVFFGAKQPRPELGNGLRAAGLTLTYVAAYHVATFSGPPPPSGELVLLFSPSGVSSLVERVQQASAHPVLAVGPTTAAAAEKNGFPVRGILASPQPSSLTAFLKQ